MKSPFLAAALLALAATPALAGLAVGDRAPTIDGKEFVNTPALGAKDLQGKVVFVEVFRTW